MIIVKSRKENFRRAGVVHSVAPREYADDFFTTEQLAILKAEPMLTVTEMPGDPGGLKKEAATVGTREEKALFKHIAALEDRVIALEEKTATIDDLILAIREQIESINGMIENADEKKAGASEKAEPKAKPEKKDKKA